MTGAVLRWTAAQLKRGDPPWWKAVAKAWENRAFVAWSEAWSLYVTALHFEALNDADCPLVPYFPSCGGTAEADPSPGLLKFLSQPTESFLDNLKTRHRRTYVAARAPLWIAPAMLFFQRKRGLPFYLLETNAGAGLNLAADVVAKQKHFDSGLVAARIGLDPQPLETADLVQRRWLTAGVWPDNTRGIGELDAAIDAVQARARRDATFIQLGACAPEKAPAFAAKNIPADDPDVGLLMFNMGSTVRMTDEQYARYAQAVAATLKPWGDRGLWVEVETVRGEMYSTTFQLRAHRVLDGVLRSFTMASFDLVAATHAYSDAALKFLEVA